MTERSDLITWIRGELVGPSRPLVAPELVTFAGREFRDNTVQRRGPLAWQRADGVQLEEVLYYERESPHRKYGVALLHPASARMATRAPDHAAVEATDTLGAEPGTDDSASEVVVEAAPPEDDGDAAAGAASQDRAASDEWDDFEVTSPDVRHPSTMGISFCARLEQNGEVVVTLPHEKRMAWQPNDAAPFALNARYESCTRIWSDSGGAERRAPIWRRVPVVASDTFVTIRRSELIAGRKISKSVTLLPDSPLTLQVDVFPRLIKNTDNLWLLTVVLRNTTEHTSAREPREAVLYQSLFEVRLNGGRLEKYPESGRRFEELDAEEQSLALLYRESATWGIGHGCAAAWDTVNSEAPYTIYADAMPAVELPSMTPDIEVDGQPLQLSMRTMADLAENQSTPAWTAIMALRAGYATWIAAQRTEISSLAVNLQPVAARHMDACDRCLRRMDAGIELLKTNVRARQAFRFANLAMLLQQIATKQLQRRPLTWNTAQYLAEPDGEALSPWDIYHNEEEDLARLGSWRAFQIAFLLMSLSGVFDDSHEDRDVVDLVWFPTGGGKTEAYLAVMAFYMFNQRLLMGTDAEQRRDGTNVLMRYTLRMLTTQQFQRAASLICAMEYIRRNPSDHRIGDIPGGRFSLGLWIGGDGSPNKVRQARTEITRFRRGDIEGNPLVLTECPWCRSEIGRFKGDLPPRPRKKGQTTSGKKGEENSLRTRGIVDDGAEGPRLVCPDASCTFGGEYERLPVEVIDERIYNNPPSLVIATADKLAMIAYRPAAGVLFGRRVVDGTWKQSSHPPGLIIQDELHLISGPLGTMYGLYEGVFERLCSYRRDDVWVKPKLIASTATIRGAAEQVLSLYARSKTELFPTPGLTMGDSFFGKYARDKSGNQRGGRLYLGIHASDYGSVLTTQVRAFSTALFRPWSLPAEKRDPWWTLLAFYNSIRELAGAKTLFDSDIRSRLKFMFNRENYPADARRNLRIVEELTSRLSQAEIVKMMDRLSATYSAGAKDALDACLASSIIEVGVDIDRLSLMGVVGQPKTTATYIQVTGRVGRRWWERPGLILMIYNPSKSRDRSHFEQFHSYHRRLYERVEPTSATPFALSAIQRALPGALIAWARASSDIPVQDAEQHLESVEEVYQLLRERCGLVQSAGDVDRSLAEMERVREELEWKWDQNPQEWEEFPPAPTGEYLMLWPGQFATALQQRRGVVVPSSMRQVDRSAELNITQGYALEAATADGRTGAT